MELDNVCELRPDVTGFINRTGRTQQSLANELGCSRSRVAQWCNGNADISRTDCGSLLKLGMTVAEIFGDDVEESVRREYSGCKMDFQALTDDECAYIVKKGVSIIVKKRLL